MNPRQELQALFERTHEDEAVILRRMATTVRRRSRHVTTPTPIAWVMAAACLLGAALFWVGLPLLRTRRAPDHSITAEPFNTASRPEGIATARPAYTPKPSVAPEADASAASVVPSRVPTRVRSHARSTQTMQQQPATATPNEAAPASWQAVAEALRTGNRPKASGLLDDLARSHDPEVRDSAELVRLRSALTEVDNEAIAKPPSAAQLKRLEELARTGATSSIRASARKLLTEVRRSSDLR